MNCRFLRRHGAAVWVAAALAVAAPGSIHAQGRGGRGGPPGPPRSPQASAPLDLTGYWVALVTEDWRWRMVTAPKGDVASVPLNQEGRKLANEWDPAKDEAAGNQCKAYGAGGIMRIPTRLHITWSDENTLRVDTDAGTQTRLFHFGTAQASGEPTWQGYSAAQWEVAGGGRGGRGAPPQGGSLKAVTTHMRAGYLRKNGVPYSEKATVTEYLDRTMEPDGNSYLIVTTIVEDPEYLAQPFITSTHFKKQADAAGWNPTPCDAR
ncbi:MAG: hypothetical protein LAP40_16775 [Acidobacteriia bacterium]|nr:hypothetical protein [Terriglobia bacterium]